MTTYVHLVGPQLAGKTYVREQAQERLGDRMQAWDAWEWYREHDVIDEDGRINWRLRTDTAPQLQADLTAWLAEVDADVAVVESSGIGSAVNDVMGDTQHHRIRVEESPAEDIAARAKARGLDPLQVEGYNSKIRDKLTDPVVTQVQAIAQIGALAVKAEGDTSAVAAARQGLVFVALAQLFEEPADSAERSVWNTIATVGTQSGACSSGQADITITAEELAEYVDLFAVVGREVPVDVNHAHAFGETSADDTAARGWITALRSDDEKLEALIRWTAEGADLVRTEKFRYFSLELGPVFGESAEDVVGWTITGGTLTNHPYWDLPALAASRAVRDDITAHSGGSAGEPTSTREGDTNRTSEERPMPDIKALAKRLGVDEDKVESTYVAMATEIRDLRQQAKDNEAATAKIAEDAFIAALYTDGCVTEDREALARWSYQQDTEQAKALFSVKVVPVDKPKGGTREDTSTDSPIDRGDAGNRLNESAVSLMTKGDAEDYPTAFALARQQNPTWADAYESKED